jgi:predicted DsbA family dithiol-disulfide isomerase
VKATNAWACSLDEGLGEEYMDALYSIQGNFTDNQLLSTAEGVGLSGDTFESCVEDGAYESWVDASHSLGVDDFGVNSTPTIFVVNGDDRTVVDSAQWTQEGLRAALEASAGGTPSTEAPAAEGAADDEAED